MNVANDQTLLARLSSRLLAIAPDQVDGAIVDALEIVGDRCGADAVAWLEVTGSEQAMRRTHVWFDSRVGAFAPSNANVKTLCDAPIPFDPSGVVMIEDVASCPDDLPESVREFVTTIGARSVAWIPVRSAGTIVAMIGMVWRVRRAPVQARDLASLTVFGDLVFAVRTRAQTERKLRNSERHLALAMEAADLSTWHWDIGKDAIRRSGRAIIAALDVAEPVSFGRFLQSVHPDDRAEVDRQAQRALAGECDYQIEFRFDRGDGSFGWAYAHGQLFSDAGGRPLAMAGVILDVTERHRIEEELHRARAMEAIGRLAGGVAHDFNNVLSVILGHAELSLGRLATTDDLHRPLVEIREAAERAARLTRQLLMLGRKQVLELTQVDLNGVIRNLEPMLRRLMPENIALELTLASNVAAVRADPTQLDQILVNLVTNARDAMPRGGRLTIATSEITVAAGARIGADGLGPGAYVVLSVSDTGEGMDAETLSRAFEPFFSTKPIGFGYGLGLASVYAVVKQHGGHVLAASELGRGSLFRVVLPRAPSDSRTAHVAEPDRTAGSPRVSSRPAERTLLVVEDEEPVRRFVMEALHTLGYRVIGASSGSEALAASDRHVGSIDLLLTDVVMPGLTGKELYGRLRSLRPGLRVLYMSGYANDMIAAHGVLEPDVVLIQKPFSLDALAHEIETVLAR